MSFENGDIQELDTPGKPLGHHDTALRTKNTITRLTIVRAATDPAGPIDGKEDDSEGPEPAPYTVDPGELGGCVAVP